MQSALHQILSVLPHSTHGKIQKVRSALPTPENMPMSRTMQTEESQIPRWLVCCASSSILTVLPQQETSSVLSLPLSTTVPAQQHLPTAPDLTLPYRDLQSPSFRSHRFPSCKTTCMWQRQNCEESPHRTSLRTWRETTRCPHLCLQTVMQ